MRHQTAVCICNEGVACDDKAHCLVCGWNPKVAAERSAKILERIKSGNTEAEIEGEE